MDVCAVRWAVNEVSDGSGTILYTFFFSPLLLACAEVVVVCISLLYIWWKHTHTHNSLLFSCFGCCARICDSCSLSLWFTQFLCIRNTHTRIHTPYTHVCAFYLNQICCMRMMHALKYWAQYSLICREDRHLSVRTFFSRSVSSYHISCTEFSMRWIVVVFICCSVLIRQYFFTSCSIVFS